MKKCIIIFIIAIMLLSSCNAGINSETNKKAKSILCVELRQNSGHYCYYFLLNEDRELIVWTDYGSLDALIENKMNISTEHVVKIDESDYNELVSLIKNLKDLNIDDDLVLDHWTFSIFVNNEKHYYHTYGCAKKSGYDSLITRLIELSPIYVDAKPFSKSKYDK